MIVVDPAEVVLETTASAEERPSTELLEATGGAIAGNIGNTAMDDASPREMDAYTNSNQALQAEDGMRQVVQEAQETERPASPQMKAPHISTLYDKQEVMIRRFGVTQKQALRTQALLRLGVTETDVRIAERLMASRSGDSTQSKEEWLLGVTYAQMSFHKALQVLGISEAVVEEERSKRLGELGLGVAGGTSESLAGKEGEDTCGGFFAKKRRSTSQGLGTTLPGEVAFAPTHKRVLQLEEVCHSQMTRIQELEQQLAALSAKSSSSAP